MVGIPSERRFHIGCDNIISAVFVAKNERIAHTFCAFFLNNNGIAAVNRRKIISVVGKSKANALSFRLVTWKIAKKVFAEF